MKSTSSISSSRQILLRFVFPWLLVIAVVAIGLDLYFSAYIIKKGEISGAAKLERITHTFGQEIPIIGTSRALRSFLPDSLPHTYNYGIEGTGFEVSMMFLEMELQKDKTTPIIYSFDEYAFHGAIGNIINYLPYISSQAGIVQLLKEKNQLKWWYYIPGLRYYGNYDLYLRNYYSNINHPGKYNSRGGSFDLGITDSIRFNNMIQQRKKTSWKWEMDTERNNRMLNLFKSHPQRDFILVITPVHYSFFSNMSGMAELKAYWKSLNQIPNVHLIHIDGSNYPNSYFKNTSHLNMEGAKVFSSTLLRELKKLQLVTGKNPFSD